MTTYNHTRTPISTQKELVNALVHATYCGDTDKAYAFAMCLHKLDAIDYERTEAKAKEGS